MTVCFEDRDRLFDVRSHVGEDVNELMPYRIFSGGKVDTRFGWLTLGVGLLV